MEKIAVVQTYPDGIERTLSVHGTLREARMVIKMRRWSENHCTEANMYTGSTYRLMRGTSAKDWREVR